LIFYFSDQNNNNEYRLALFIGRSRQTLFTYQLFIDAFRLYFYIISMKSIHNNTESRRYTR